MAKVLRFLKPDRLSITMVYVIGLVALVAAANPRTAEIVSFRLEEMMRFMRNALAYTF